MPDSTPLALGGGVRLSQGRCEPSFLGHRLDDSETLQAGYFESRATSDLEDRTIAATEGTHTIAQDTMDLAAYVVLGPSGGRKDAELWLIHTGISLNRDNADPHNEDTPSLH